MNPTKENPDGYIVTDETVLPGWASQVNWRKPNVQQKASAKTRHCNHTSGEMAPASRRDKKEKPYLWETDCYAKRQTVNTKPRLVKGV